jgi:hypothetical protein
VLIGRSVSTITGASVTESGRRAARRISRRIETKAVSIQRISGMHTAPK